MVWSYLHALSRQDQLDSVREALAVLTNLVMDVEVIVLDPYQVIGPQTNHR